MYVYIYIYIYVCLCIYIYIYIYIYAYTYSGRCPCPLPGGARRCRWRHDTPNLPTNIIPTKIARVNFYGKFPMGLGIPPLRIKIMLESNPLKSTMLVGRLGVNNKRNSMTTLNKKNHKQESQTI